MPTAGELVAPAATNPSSATNPASPATRPAADGTYDIAATATAA